MRRAFLLGTVGLLPVEPGVPHAARVTAISARSEDGTVVACDVLRGLDLSAFPVGMQVKLHRHRPDGRFRLGLIQSDKAVMEVPH
jgi:hypothetical protein